MSQANKRFGIVFNEKSVEELKALSARIDDENEESIIQEIIGNFNEWESNKIKTPSPVTSLKDTKRLSNYLDSKRDHNEDVPYLHEILKDCQVHVPPYEPPPRNPELEARIKRLKAEQEERVYKRMTADVSGPISSSQTTNFSTDIKSLRSQLIAVLNFVLTVGGSFMFMYKAVEYSLPVPNIPAQVLFGVFTAVVVAIAEIYFLARYMLD